MAGKEALQRLIDAVEKGKATEDMVCAAENETYDRIAASFNPFREVEVPFIIIALNLLEQDLRGRFKDAAKVADDRMYNDDLGAEENREWRMMDERDKPAETHRV